MVEMSPETRKYSLIAGVAFLAFGLGMYALSGNRRAATDTSPSVEIRPFAQQASPTRTYAAPVENTPREVSSPPEAQPSPAAVAGEGETAPEAPTTQTFVQTSPAAAQPAPTTTSAQPYIPQYVPPVVPPQVPAASGGSAVYIPRYSPPSAYTSRGYAPQRPYVQARPYCCAPPPPRYRQRMSPPPQSRYR